jgi:hypothetical protein
MNFSDMKPASIFTVEGLTRHGQNVVRTEDGDLGAGLNETSVMKTSISGDITPYSPTKVDRLLGGKGLFLVTC